MQIQSKSKHLNVYLAKFLQYSLTQLEYSSGESMILPRKKHLHRKTILWIFDYENMTDTFEAAYEKALLFFRKTF